MTTMELDCSTTIYNDDLTSFVRSLSKHSVSCLDVTPEFILISCSSGTLIVVDRATFTVTEPFSGLLGTIVCTSVQTFDNYVNIALGFDSGAISFISILTADPRKYFTHVDRDCHRNSSVIAISWSADCSKVFSADECGTITVSHINFENDTFSHSFFSLSGCRTISLIQHANILINFLEDGTYQFICSNTGENLSVNLGFERFTDLLGCIKNEQFIAVATKKEIFSLNLENAVWKLQSIFTSVREIMHLDWTRNFVTVSYENNIEVLTREKFSLVFKLVRTALLDPRLCCLDHDGSLLYILNGNHLHRASLTPLTNVLSDAPADRMDVGSLFESPRKLGASLLKRASNVFQAVSSASEIEVTTEVPKILESGLNAIRNNSNLSSVVERVQYLVDSQCGSDIVEGVPFIKPSVSTGVDEETALDCTVSVERKLKTKGRRRRDSEMIPNKSEPREMDIVDMIEQPEEIIQELRRHILGHSTVSSSPPARTESVSSSVNEGGAFNSSTTSFRSPTAFSVPRDNLDSGPSSVSDKFSASFVSCLTDLAEPPVESSSVVQEPESTVSAAFDILLNSTRNEALPVDINDDIENMEVARLSHLQNSFPISDLCDSWKETILPFSVSSLSVYENKLVVCHRRRKPRYCDLDHLGNKDIKWSKLDWNAQEISFSDQDVIRLYNGCCYVASSGLNVFPSEEIPIVGGKVSNITLDNGNIWYNTEDLGPCVLMKSAGHSSFTRLSCEWPLSSLTISKYAVWAVRKNKGSLMARVGLSRCQMGYDWVETMPEGMSNIVSSVLHDTSGFALDDQGRLWMAIGVDQHHPFGSCASFLEIRVPWQTQCYKAKYLEWKLLATEVGLFVCSPKIIYTAFNSLSGHGFPVQISNKYITLDNFTFIAASSFSYDSLSLENDSIFLCRPNSDVFVFRPKRKVVTNISLPPNILAITSLSCFQDSISIVDSLGNVHIRKVFGGCWKEEENLPNDGIISYCQSSLATWIVTCDGSIKCKPIGENWATYSVNIVSVEERRVTQITCSPNGRYVWVNDGNSAWARTNVDSHNPNGKRWTQTHNAHGIISIAAGDCVVWALDESYNLLRLQGLAAGNPAGNSWKHVCSNIRAISVDSHNCLWALNGDNRLVKYMCALFPDRN